ncbi:MAG: hypothetical protein ACYTBJ_17320 [Planctomycetota bacterium]|jgi:hypothetical protein
MANHPLSKEKIEEMFDAFLEHADISYVMKKCGVAYGTAEKYIKWGDPVRGYEPFTHRVLLTEVTTETKRAMYGMDVESMRRLQLKTRRLLEVMLKVYTHRAKEMEKNPNLKLLGARTVKDLLLAMKYAADLDERLWISVTTTRKALREAKEARAAAIVDVKEAPPFVEPNMQDWTPIEVDRYRMSLEEGKNPEYPEWYNPDHVQAERPPKMLDGANPSRQIGVGVGLSAPWGSEPHPVKKSDSDLAFPDAPSEDGEKIPE